MFPKFLQEDVLVVAKKLLGCILECEIDGQIVRVRIVETEAYDQYDEASHAFGGERVRNKTMFREAGHLYVYFTYGMHYCCNVVTGAEGHGAGVLIRAAEPIEGIDAIERRRGMSGVNTTNGPAKLCQALGITLEQNGHDLHEPPIRLINGSLAEGESIAITPRIGISKAKDELRRFYINGNSYVSRS